MKNDEENHKNSSFGQDIVKYRDSVKFTRFFVEVSTLTSYLAKVMIEHLMSQIGKRSL